MNGIVGNNRTEPKLSLRYTELPADGDVASLVLNYWVFDVVSLGPEPYEHHVPPDGCTSLVVRYSETKGSPVVLLVGPRTEVLRVTISSRDSYFGVRFWPHASAAILKEHLARCRDFLGPAAQLFPEMSPCLMERLPSRCDRASVIDALRRLAYQIASNAQPVDNLAKRAVEAIALYDGKTSVGQIADELGISQRQLQRRFRAATGLTPKEFSRVRRFRRAAAELLEDKPRPWITVAYDAGYSDQAHLVREFAQMTGLTAEELRRKHAVIEHEDVLP